MSDNDDNEKYRLIRTMDEKARKEWVLLQQQNFERLQDERAIDVAKGLSEQEIGDRQAVLRAELDAIEAAHLAHFHEQDEIKSRFFTDEDLRREDAQRETETNSQFFDTKERQRLADEAQQAALDEQVLQQDNAAKAQIAAEQLGVADAAREQEAIQKRNAEIIEQNRQIQEQIEAGTLQPPTLEQADEAIRKQFDGRREELAESIEKGREQEIEKTIGGIDDREMTEYLEQQRQEIEQKWAAIEAERLAAIAREEQARLSRERDFYDRAG